MGDLVLMTAPWFIGYMIVMVFISLVVRKAYWK
jgi:hypothetical protein